MARHHVNLIDLDFALQLHFGGFGHEAAAQLLRHGLHVGPTQTQLACDLPVGEVQAHEVEAQHPHAQRLVAAGQHRAGEVVEAGCARSAPIPLPMRLRVVVPVPDHRVAAAPGTAHAIGPAMLAHQGEAFGVVHQAGEVDQVQCSHDGGNSSREPVSYASFHRRTRRLQPRSSAPTSPPRNTTRASG